MHGQLTVQWGPLREPKLLAVLLTRPRHRFTADELLSWLWTDDEALPRNLHQTLQTKATRLRQALHRAGNPAILPRADRGYRIEVDKNVIDYHAFQLHVSNARALSAEGRHREVVGRLERALSLWADEPLAELDSEPAREWRRTVQDNDLLPANVLLLDAELKLGRLHDALHRLDDLQRQHGDDVDLAVRRLRVLHGLCRFEEADEYYLRTRRRLDRAAADELRRCQDALLAGRDRVAPAERVMVAAHESPPPPRLLPHDLPGFAGREDVLTELDRATGVADEIRPGVVVVSGLGGVGKTVTVVHWAHRVADRFPDGVLFADLRGFSADRPMADAELVDLFLTALRSPMEHVTRPNERAEKLRARLTGRRTLVVLDNAASTQHVQSVLPLLAGCVVVVTSRHWLTGLNRFPRVVLRPMVDEAARELLAARIGERAEREPAALAELARLCAGVPLALTLVADQAVRSGAPLAQLARRLRDPETLLGIGDDGDGVDTSLRAVFSLSYHALELADARLFRLLGLHPGAEFGVAAAAALAGEPMSTVERRVATLASAHLLEQPGEVDRYRMHDLLFAYAAALAADHDEGSRARTRLLNFYLHTAHTAHRTVFPHRQVPPMPDRVPDTPVLSFTDEREAARWCLRERASLVAAARHAARNGHHDYAWRLPHTIIDLLKRHGYYSDGRAALEVAVSSAVRDHQPSAEAASLNDLGHLSLTMGDTDASIGYFLRALRLAKEIGDRVGLLTASLNIGRWQRQLGQLDAAIATYRECAEMAEELCDHDRRASAAHRLGEVFVDAGRYPLAEEQFLRALRIREQIGDLSGRVETLGELAALSRELGHPLRARKHCEQAKALLEQIQGVGAGMRTYLVLAELELDEQRTTTAEQHAEEALYRARRAGSATDVAQVLVVLGTISRARGEADVARDRWLRARDIFAGHHRLDDAKRMSERIAALEVAQPMIPNARTPSARDTTQLGPRTG
ncbi:Transcriptional regulatory protein, C terminal [Amycolatopsis arida]|uniref:Transcriptional regulatory protein, C terminal n=1 Tax=Amycolatopsis arida TaxID=587909 RepID=A0A1I5YI73_9PSEU|nr:tetratricopeptide repeat protein [Amycolatopsis arida]TDX90532.1 transcriptional regulator [Amycolatopsis arida]SFQ43886.1 Transcriptional regulatory protein, C terminal [Amycolatopsis arida]